jgi:hypothetical protein
MVTAVPVAGAVVWAGRIAPDVGPAALAAIDPGTWVRVGLGSFANITVLIYLVIGLRAAVARLR